MRSKRISMTGAAREVGISPGSVTRWGKTALRKNKAGRFVAKKTDRLLRVLQIPTSDGLRDIALRNSQEATILSGYSEAVNKYISIGEADLTRYAHVYLTDVSGARVPLLTDLTEIDRLASAGVLSFESLYSRT
jgi:hypothetical protein